MAESKYDIQIITRHVIRAYFSLMFFIYLGHAIYALQQERYIMHSLDSEPMWLGGLFLVFSAIMTMPLFLMMPYDNYVIPKGQFLYRIRRAMRNNARMASYMLLYMASDLLAAIDLNKLYNDVSLNIVSTIVSNMMYISKYIIYVYVLVVFLLPLIESLLPKKTEIDKWQD